MDVICNYYRLTREFREAPNGAVNSCIPELGKFKILKLRLLP